MIPVMFVVTAVEALRVSLHICLTVCCFVLVSVAKLVVIAMSSVLVIAVVRGTRTVPGLAVLLAVVPAILKAILESRAAVVAIAVMFPTVLSASMFGAFL